MKRGVSPLLAYVFLVALVVSVGMIVTSALIERAQNIDIEDRIEYCEDVTISLEGACKENGAIKVNITNWGSFSIHKMTLGRETNISAHQWCVYPETFSAFPINPGDTGVIPLSLNATFLTAVNASLPECNDNDEGDAGVAEIAITPWIKPEPEGEIFPCGDKKIVWDQNLNNAC